MPDPTQRLLAGDLWSLDRVAAQHETIGQVWYRPGSGSPAIRGGKAGWVPHLVGVWMGEACLPCYSRAARLICRRSATRLATLTRSVSMIRTSAAPQAVCTRSG